MSITDRFLPYLCYRCKNYIKHTGATMVFECAKYEQCAGNVEKKIAEYKKLEYSVGDKIKFIKEKRPYKIQACNENYIIATKPYNIKHTFLYVIVDFKTCVRGADNYHCKYDYDKPAEASEALKDLINGDMEVSHRNYCELDIDKIIRGNK